MESTVINKITVTDDIAVITITPPQKMPHLAYTLLCELSDKKINLITINTVLHGGITVAASDKNLCEILKITGRQNGVLTTVTGANSKISILGENLDNTDFIVKKILDPLSEYNADIRLISVSAHEISLIMPTYKIDPFLDEITK